MKSAPHLLTEDRPEFERVLDEALRTADRRPDLSGIGQRLTAEQLRTMALGASAAIAACAAAEYQEYRDTRARLREPAPLFPLTGGGGESPDGTGGLAGALQDAAGAGLVAMLAVLAPVLAGTAAIIFLIVGYVLNALHPAPSIAQPLVTAGWLFAALTAVGILIAAVGLLLTALRNGSSAIRGGARSEQLEEVDRAREVWRQALLDRGILPFLREALANPSAPSPAAYVPRNPEAVGRTPHLGYSRPGFSTDGESPKARPRYSSPDYTSPDYGGPEHQPD
ncbi:hypothetical protein ABZ654_08480 [Streptomyces hygroscopicus]|uniref:Membrane protein n=1 Tax=Streptomyces hygroscopicus TaxID=1912 RepID=A0ABQ3U2R9_STRHY|nr:MULTISPECIES: hypothetical protein [Streptomyces]MDN3056635.1 hypothetical protein [Streptomyces sp. SRF1]GHJ29899.1 membrane protein [Streptomyces hygroscopicus]